MCCTKPSKPSSAEKKDVIPGESLYCPLIHILKNYKIPYAPPPSSNTSLFIAMHSAAELPCNKPNTHSPSHNMDKNKQTTMEKQQAPGKQPSQFEKTYVSFPPLKESYTSLPPKESYTSFPQFLFQVNTNSEQGSGPKGLPEPRRVSQAPSELDGSPTVKMQASMKTRDDLAWAKFDPRSEQAALVYLSRGR
jgi:hypothetical protein